MARHLGFYDLGRAAGQGLESCLVKPGSDWDSYDLVAFGTLKEANDYFNNA